MDRWAGALYGDPCRECGFAFSTGRDESLTFIGGIPDRFSELLADADGTERHPDLSWPVGSYVCHVADNLRIWAERLAGSAAGTTAVAPYDENLLAQARSYADVPLQSALWSLGRGRGDWQAAVAAMSREKEIVIVHRERGDMQLEDVARGVAHDAFHHAWDIRRSLEVPSPPST
jgi:DinB family protein